MKHRLLPLVLVVVTLQLVAVASLVSGRDTLYLRDVLNTHLTMKLGQVAAVTSGESGLVDSFRGGGQPLAGNPNALPFYPTTVLFLLFPPLWALNAHFWVHFLLAPVSMAALARSLGWSRGGAWAAGAGYGLGGYLLSVMSYFNLVAAAALAPAFLAAVVRATRGDRLATPAAGLLWGLLCLGGDPISAVFCLAAALSIVATTGRVADSGRVAVALVAGTGLALPQLVELLRILPASVRGLRGFVGAEQSVASLDPRQLLEAVFPFLFGRLDHLGQGSFWGHAYYSDALPFFLSLAPGILVLGLVAAARRGEPYHGLAWSWVGVGLFLSLGGFNPLLAPLLGRPEAGLLRFPVKAWLLVALGLGLLAGRGWEGALEARERGALKRFHFVVLVGAGIAGLTAVWCVLFAPFAQVVARAVIPAARPDAFVTAEVIRWARIGASVAAVGVGASIIMRLGRRRPLAAGSLLLALHVGSQLFLLAPCLARDRSAPYREQPRALDLLEGRRRVAHGSVGRLFGPRRYGPPEAEDRPAHRLARRAALELYPFVGVRWGLRYELALSPEGLDSYLTRLAADAVRTLGDRERVRLLRTWGVEALLLSRPLAGGTGATQMARVEEGGAKLMVYAVDEPVEPVRVVHGARWASDPGGALEHLLDPSFDPTNEVVLAGSGVAAAPGTGKATVIEETTDRLRIEVRTERAAVVVVERAHLPLYRATVDDTPTAVEIANLHRIGVEVESGDHVVTLELDRGPGRIARLAVALSAGLLLLLGRKARARLEDEV